MTKKYKYRVIYTGTQIPTEKAKQLSWEAKPFEAVNTPCAWCKTAENAEKRFLKYVKEVNEFGIFNFTVTEYHIEKAEI